MYIRKTNRKIHSIYAMSRIGILPQNIELRIYTDDPGKIPHFHFVSKDGLDGCIRIDKPEYFPHGHHKSKLNTRQIRELVRFLKKPSKKSGMTNWEVVLLFWNTNNSDIELPEDYPMPDYLHELVE